MHAGRPPKARRRLWALAALAITICAGLTSRSGWEYVPPFIAQNAGDALWTMAVYFALVACAPGMPRRRVFLIAVAASLTVEIGQLWHPSWLEAVRSTTLGRLVLGQGWQWVDLPRYLVGALLALSADGQPQRAQEDHARLVRKKWSARP